MTVSWTGGVRLVARRGLVEILRSKTYKVVTGMLLLVSVGAVVVPQLVGDDGTTYTLATVGEAPAGVRVVLDAAAGSGEFETAYVTRADEESVRRAVRDGDATAGLVDDTLYASAEQDGTFAVLVSQAVVGVETEQRLEDAGLDPAEIRSALSVQPPEQVVVGRVDDERRAGVGFAVGIVLYVALVFAGNAIATAVAMEKSTRISEVLLAVLRPSQIVVGTVTAVGLTTLTQLLILAVPLAVAARVTDLGLPAAATSDLALAVAWFVLGFSLYAFLFAASAALVDKITEVSTAVIPVSTVLVIGYMLGVTVVMGDPTSPWSALISMFPVTAPMAMPIRWSSGEVPVYQLVVAMVLTVATAALLVVVSSSVYRRALLITGRRVRLREVLGEATPSR
jgi:ABC-2 type transport system permease protein